MLNRKLSSLMRRLDIFGVLSARFGHLQRFLFSRCLSWHSLCKAFERFIFQVEQRRLDSFPFANFERSAGL